MCVCVVHSVKCLTIAFICIQFWVKCRSGDSLVLYAPTSLPVTAVYYNEWHFQS